MRSKRTLLSVAAAILSLAVMVPAVAATPRSGDIHITKECSEFNGAAGEHCTITSSNVPAIPRGSRVIYLAAADFTNGVLDTNIVLDPPGPGNNRAFGHVHLDLQTGTGLVTFSGGTGVFTWFHGRADVSALGGYDWGWEGTYRFGSGS
jgi:hypothetical protein